MSTIVSFMREERAHMETRMKEQLEETELRAEARRQREMRELEAKLRPQEAVSAERLSALQARLEAVHAAQLLSDDALHALEDCVADYLDLVASIGVVTTGMASAHSAASKLMKLAVLSERMTSDAAFARQCQRKFCSG